MRYCNVKTARFVRRCNRFLAEVLLDGTLTPVHVKNTGRLRELLTPETTVFLSGTDNPARKTAWDLFAVEHRGEIVNIDSQAPNIVFGEFLTAGGYLDGLTLNRPECRWGSSRFDFYLETARERRFTEVKGVTLRCDDGLFRFPDAPTTRGAKHLKELSACLQAGYTAGAVFVVTRRCSAAVAPNEATDPAFCAALREAAAAGVHVRAFDCAVTEDGLSILGEVPVQL